MHPDAFKDAALVVLGHGTTQNDASAAPVLQHAAELRRRRLFAAVEPAFWKQAPQIEQVLRGLEYSRVFIVPMFISEGYFASKVIPEALGFPAPNSRLQIAGREHYYTLPVGSHDRMTAVVLARASGVVAQFPFPRAPKPADTTLLIAGHGTERDADSRLNIDRQVARIHALGQFAGVQALFLDQEPRISRFHEFCATRAVVMVPFFISDGLHAVEDIPVLLGEPERLVQERLAAGQPTWRNPTERQGHRIWYSGAVGADPLVADIILERVREAAESRPAAAATLRSAV